MSVWVECFLSIRFDLNVGPKVEHISPPGALSTQSVAKVLQCAFPDCNQSQRHDFIFFFTMRDCSVPVEQLAAHELRPQSPSPASNGDLAKMYGATYYRQKYDPSVPRGYVQQVVVLLSRLPYFAVHELILRVVVPRFCQCCPLSPDTEKVAIASPFAPVPTTLFELDHSFNANSYTQGEVLDEAVAQIARWPSPHPRARYDVMLLHQSLDFVTPSAAPRPRRTLSVRPRTRLDDRVTCLSTRGGGAGGYDDRVHDVLPLYGLLGSHLHHLTYLWELLITHESLLIVSNSPSMASAAAFAVASLVMPIEFNGMLRPYFTVQNEDFGRLSRMGTALPFPLHESMLVAATNPFFLRHFDGWRNLLVSVDHHAGERDSPAALTVAKPLQTPVSPSGALRSSMSGGPSGGRNHANADRQHRRTGSSNGSYASEGYGRAEQEQAVPTAPPTSLAAAPLTPSAVSLTSATGEEATEVMGTPFSRSYSQNSSRGAGGSQEWSANNGADKHAARVVNGCAMTPVAAETGASPLMTSTTATVRAGYLADASGNADSTLTGPHLCDGALVAVTPTVASSSGRVGGFAQGMDGLGAQSGTTEHVIEPGVVRHGRMPSSSSSCTTSEVRCREPLCDEVKPDLTAQRAATQSPQQQSSHAARSARPLLVPAAECHTTGSGSDGQPARSPMSPIFTAANYQSALMTAQAAPPVQRAHSGKGPVRSRLQYHMQDHFESDHGFLLDHAGLTRILLRRLETMSRLDTQAQLTSISLSLQQWCGGAEGRAAKARRRRGMGTYAPGKQRSPCETGSDQAEVGSSNHHHHCDCATPPLWPSRSASGNEADAMAASPTAATDAAAAAAATAAVFAQFSVADDIVRKFFTSLTMEFLTPVTAWFTATTAPLTAFHLCDRDMAVRLLQPDSFLAHLKQHHHTTAPSMWTQQYNYSTYRTVYEYFARGSLFRSFVLQLLDHKLRDALEEFQVDEWASTYPVVSERVQQFRNLHTVVQYELCHAIDPDVLFVTTATSVLAGMAASIDNPLREQLMLEAALLVKYFQGIELSAEQKDRLCAKYWEANTIERGEIARAYAHLFSSDQDFVRRLLECYDKLRHAHRGGGGAVTATHCGAGQEGELLSPNQTTSSGSGSPLTARTGSYDSPTSASVAALSTASGNALDGVATNGYTPVHTSLRLTHSARLLRTAIEDQFPKLTGPGPYSIAFGVVQTEAERRAVIDLYSSQFEHPDPAELQRLVMLPQSVSTRTRRRVTGSCTWFIHCATTNEMVCAVTITAHHYSRAHHFVEMPLFATAAGYKRNGFGRLLNAALAAWCVREEFEFIMISADVQAIPFWEHLGYVLMSRKERLRIAFYYEHECYKFKGAEQMIGYCRWSDLAEDERKLVPLSKQSVADVLRRMPRFAITGPLELPCA